MTTIKATCPMCGEVTLTPRDIELFVDPSGEAEATYSFECPDCGHTIRKPADDRIVRLLISGGVSPLEPEPAQAAASEGPKRPDRAPLSHDDLLDFHALLQDPDWFDRLLASSSEQR